MTRNYNRDRIAIVRHADSSKGVRVPDGLSDVPVAAGFAVRDVEKGTPAFQLKISAAQIQRKREIFAMAGEVFVKLTEPGAKRTPGFLPGLVRCLGELAAIEFQSHQASRGKGEE